jgi:hypothetical protein
MWGETQVELPRRIAAFIRRRGFEPELGTELAEACLAAVEANIVPCAIPETGRSWPPPSP